jgi:chaperonin GroEL
VDGEALATLVRQQGPKSLNVVAIKAPVLGNVARRFYKIFAILTGGRLISEEVGLSLDTVSLDLLGQAAKITLEKDNTIIVASGDSRNKADVQNVSPN